MSLWGSKPIKSVDTILAEVSVQFRERRERIAVAVLSGLCARPLPFGGQDDSDRVKLAIWYADTLMEELRK